MVHRIATHFSFIVTSLIQSKVPLQVRILPALFAMTRHLYALVRLIAGFIMPCFHQKRATVLSVFDCVPFDSCHFLALISWLKLQRQTTNQSATFIAFTVRGRNSVLRVLTKRWFRWMHSSLPAAYFCTLPHIKHWEVSSRDGLLRALLGLWIIQTSTARHAGRTRREYCTRTQHKHVQHPCKMSVRHTQDIHMNMQTLYMNAICRRCKCRSAVSASVG